MKKYQDFITDTEGHPLANVAVTVYLAGTQTLASLYSSAQLETLNPVHSDADGFYSFYVADGVYDLALAGSGIAPRIMYAVEIFSLAPQQTGVFSGEQMDESFVRLIGGISTLQMFQNFQGGYPGSNYTSEAIVGGVGVPADANKLQFSASCRVRLYRCGLFRAGQSTTRTAATSVPSLARTTLACGASTQLWAMPTRSPATTCRRRSWTSTSWALRYSPVA